MRDQELEYLHQVARLTDAAAAVEAGTFDPGCLADVVERKDELGQLARVFQNMVREVYAREQHLKQQLQELRTEVDEVEKAWQVAEITETDCFRNLRDRTRKLRGDRDVTA